MYQRLPLNVDTAVRIDWSGCVVLREPLRYAPGSHDTPCARPASSRIRSCKSSGCNHHLSRSIRTVHRVCFATFYRARDPVTLLVMYDLEGPERNGEKASALTSLAKGTTHFFFTRYPFRAFSKTFSFMNLWIFWLRRTKEEEESGKPT